MRPRGAKMCGVGQTAALCGSEVFACVFGRTFSWKTKQDSRAVACSTVRSLNRPLKIISVSSSSSPLGADEAEGE